MAPVDKVPPLPYHYDDLEPYIDTETMQLHYNGCRLPPYRTPCLSKDNPSHGEHVLLSMPSPSCRTS